MRSAPGKEMEQFPGQKRELRVATSLSTRRPAEFVGQLAN
jgi:hypothetical protein